MRLNIKLNREALPKACCCKYVVNVAQIVAFLNGAFIWLETQLKRAQKHGMAFATPNY